MRGEARRARDRTTLDVGGAAGEECMAARGADVEDTSQRGAADVLMLMMKVTKVLMLDVLMMVKVKGQVTVKVLLKVLVKVFGVKEFVVGEVFLSSLSSTSFLRTRPAARV